MEKLTTIQQREKLNDVYAAGEKGNGGAYHRYLICKKDELAWTIGNNSVGTLADISFQNGARKDQNSIHGVLDSDLLEIVKHRLECFQEGEFSSKYNERALHHVTEALRWMNQRVEDRIARNVLGTNNK